MGTSLAKPLSKMTVPAKILMNKFPGLNAAVWDVQYRLGMWDRIDSASGARMIASLEKYTNGPAILDLGCGKGVNLHLAVSKYRRYHGVDISPHSIRTARKHARPNASFEAADILRYQTSERYDAILLREVLYYLPEQSIAEFLRRITGFLEPDGKILIQFWDKSACALYIDKVLNSGLEVLEEDTDKSDNGPKMTIIVLQAPSRDRASSTVAAP
jgi:2-polyprenyl-3-methyl-5-hydroxy-6-metoxy-1,4-benzoquinol methylase